MQRTSEEKTELFAPAIVRFFINDAASVTYGAAFVRLRILALPFMEICGCVIALVLYRNIHKQPKITMKKISGDNQ